MKKDFKYREIPYNYTSFSDKEIVLKYFDQETWDIVDQLRHQRVTGRSAKLLFEIYGDLFIIDRNPYIYNDFYDNKAKRKRIHDLHKERLSIINNSSSDDISSDLVKKLVEKTRKVVDDFFNDFEAEKKRRKKIQSKLMESTKAYNIRFSALDKVSHATDATDWRVEYAQVIVYPDSIKEMKGLVKAAKQLGLKIIPRGAGTGLTGGAIPVVKNTMIINTEKLMKIYDIHKETTDEGLEIPVIDLEAGVVTQTAMDYAINNNLIFATDPTSNWACTIGGNIAENSGGKKAVIWGTAIDNIYSFNIINAEAKMLEVKRRNHPYRKILPDDDVIYDVYEVGKKDKTKIKTIELKGTDVRKKGLGKDITNKALGGVPGIQKEGGDGIIVSAKFVLYEPFKSRETVCLEFYGNNMINASKAIVDIKTQFDNKEPVYLTALEHFDDKYIEAITYRNKSGRTESPKAVLLIDVESNEKDLLNSYTNTMIDNVKKYNTEAFIAVDDFSREAFWKDRKKLSAIAKHTNAFKMNEDVVITVDKLPTFSDYVDHQNLERDLKTNILIIDDANDYLQKMDIPEDDSFLKTKIENFKDYSQKIKATYEAYLTHLDHPAREIFSGDSSFANENRSLFDLYQEGELTINFNEDIITHFKHGFYGYDEILEDFDENVKERLNKKVVIATHMHAGDGNIHVNIPVHSSDYHMMKEAEETAASIFKKTLDLDGVISGEHGIGLTKLSFLDDDILEAYAKYKEEADPDDLFNPMKLRANFPMSRVYTPSFNLLELEAFILKAADLEELSTSIAPCLRCGKCKPVCNTHYPQATMFYNPRNKIQGVGLIIEAVLYDAQTTGDLSFRHFDKLTDISDHCTLCHKCETPCPVNIDFGKVTLDIRKILVDRKKHKFKFLTWFTLQYLNSRGYLKNLFLRLGFLRFGFMGQKIAYLLNKPFSKITKKVAPKTALMFEAKFPDAGKPSLREHLNLNEPNHFYTFQQKGKEIKKTVFYFPGCGSERMFPEISMATIALLYHSGVQVIIPPEFLCCGFPMLANGRTEMAEMKSHSNRVIFHKINDAMGYLDISDVIISCGTCYEQLDSYDLSNIFEGTRLIEINEFVKDENLYEFNKAEKPLLYHEPCHSPMKKYGHDQTFQTFFDTKPNTTPNCCGDGGTLALSTPDISSQLRQRKTHLLTEYSPIENKKAEVLTTCPSCVQGLSKIENGINIKGKHLAVYLCEQLFGKNWQKDFLNHVKENEGLDRVLL